MGSARRLERLVNRGHVPGKFSQIPAPKCPNALRQTISCRRADGTRAPHGHFLDGAGGFLKVTRGNDLKCVGQQPLVDKPDGVLTRVERDRSIVLRASAHGDVHGKKLAAPRPQAIAEFSES